MQRVMSAFAHPEPHTVVHEAVRCAVKFAAKKEYIHATGVLYGVTPVIRLSIQHSWHPMPLKTSEFNMSDVLNKIIAVKREVRGPEPT